jgi:hypothetical protein
MEEDTMAYEHPISTTAEAPSTGNDMLSGTSATELTAAVHALTQAAQALTTTATQMMQIMQTFPSPPALGQTRPGAGAVTIQINTLEDDAFSEAVPTQNPPQATPLAVPMPVNTNALLQTRIIEPQPAPGRFSPGSANFRYWVAAEALARGINFWAPLLPAGTRWSVPNPMQVTLVGPGEDLNAFYSRFDGGLTFFRQAVRNRTIFSGESPDVVCHELGHAILDALKPQLFDAASTEVGAFHEAFGDMSGILCALQLPSMRQKVLSETQGRLNVTSRLSRLAEQMGWGIRQLSPTAVDPDCLRNAANRFFYRRPAQLPPRGPASQLSARVHSFSRVFTGAFLDALAGMLRLLGPADDANLLAVSQASGQLLVDGVHTAPIRPAYYSQVAAAMIQADQARNGGRFRTALSSAFVQRGILSTAAAAALTGAPVPQAVGAPADLVATAGLVGRGGIGGQVSGRQTRLAYNGQDDDAYRRGPEDAPALPIQSVSTDVGITLLVHAPAEPERFTVAPAALGEDPAGPPAPEEAARSFVEDLIQLSRIDFQAVLGQVPVMLTSPPETRRRKTHVVQETPDGPVLKRLHFDCGSHGCR